MLVITFYTSPDDDGPERSNTIETPHAQLTYDTLRFREDGETLAQYDPELGRWGVLPPFGEMVGGVLWTDVVIGEKTE